MRIILFILILVGLNANAQIKKAFKFSTFYVAA